MPLKRIRKLIFAPAQGEVIVLRFTIPLNYIG